MCTMVIIDASVFSKALPSQNKRGDPELLSWIGRRHGIVAYEQTGGYGKELRKNQRVFDLFREYRRGQRAKLIAATALQKAEDQLQNAPIKSNDRHILALALASDALVLCSGDKDLHKHFCNVRVLPKIGIQSRAIYPIKVSRKKRSEFLYKRKMPEPGGGVSTRFSHAALWAETPTETVLFCCLTKLRIIPPFTAQALRRHKPGPAVRMSASDCSFR